MPRVHGHALHQPDEHAEARQDPLRGDVRRGRDGDRRRHGDAARRRSLLVYTTTGNAASILDWMQEWQQTEWPQLRVFSTSLTDHMATFPVVGPVPRGDRCRVRRARRGQ